MNRRTFLAATAALALAPSAYAEDTEFHFNEAAAYSRPRRGVSLLVMRRGRIIFGSCRKCGQQRHQYRRNH